ncbi:MAG: acetyl-CoA carboxylase carboxyltransferase subunit alpha [Planctomycetes bacterium]|nr:acetyl-CoA carboxylase carboxyltransferase subunit alpha [Planctomycetota bacterium]
MNDGSTTASAVSPARGTSASSAINNGNGFGAYLEFEKPLQRIQIDIEEMERDQNETGRDHSQDIAQQRSRWKATLKRLYSNLTPWETVLVARHAKRPLSVDYVKGAFRDFCELHGDRTFMDDHAISGGFARIGSHRVIVIGHNKGKDIKERMSCNFGCAHPEGYRKALRLMRLAEKYSLPVVCMIDTQGAYPGIGAEERGIAYAIAVNLMEMSRLKTPIVSIVIGEGGSGGALGIGVADRVAMLQHAFYSVISPEGCAAILWKTAEQRKHAAEALRLTSKDLQQLNVIDDIIPEPVGGAHRDPEAAAANLEKYIVSTLDELKRTKVDALVARRQKRLRTIGGFFEDPGDIVRASEKKRPRQTTHRVSRLAERFGSRESSKIIGTGATR